MTPAISGLPPLREELALLPGPTLADGQPTHTLHDPVRNLFFQVDWPTFEVLQRWHLGTAATVARLVSQQTALQIDAGEVAEVVAFFRDNQLLQAGPGQAAQFAARLRERRGSALRRVLHHYLFFRVPLVKPDRWLGRWANRVDAFYSPWFAWLTLGALVWGLLEVYRQSDRFTATLVDTLSGAGMLRYGLALAAVKVLHELGHAFTAKRLGCRVPTMGIAFLVLWPVAYTDTNDVWKLTRRRDRLAVVAAGVLTELAVAAWATLAWALLPPGPPQSIAFLLATTTLVSSLLINSSPFMRFDGYFLLSDWLGMPNLHDRAFALARWDLRERLFALGAPPPEPVPRARRTKLILFAYATWTYRLVVFLGIAALVYAFFIKAIGVLLFAIEIVWFVLRPLYRELAVWRQAWPRLRHQPRARRSAAIAMALLLILLLPWPTRPSASALLRPSVQYLVYAPPHAQISAMPLREGQHVKAGDTLMALVSPELSSKLTAAQARVRHLRWDTSASSFDPVQRAQWNVSQEQLNAAEAELAALQTEARRYAPAAPFAGVLRDLPPDLKPGEWLSEGEALARLVSDQGQTVVAYLSEDDVAQIKPGDHAMFYADNPDGPIVPLEVTGIEPDAIRTLREPELAHLFGGEVLVREKNNQLHTERPVYQVTLKVTGAARAAAQHTWRGKVVIAGGWRAPGWRYLRNAAAVVRREAGF